MGNECLFPILILLEKRIVLWQASESWVTVCVSVSLCSVSHKPHQRCSERPTWLQRFSLRLVESAGKRGLEMFTTMEGSSESTCRWDIRQISVLALFPSFAYFISSFRGSRSWKVIVENAMVSDTNTSIKRQSSLTKSSKEPGSR